MNEAAKQSPGKGLQKYDPGPIIEIHLENGLTGHRFCGVPVYFGNTMHQIMPEYAADIGIWYPRRLYFCNKRTGQDTKACGETVAQLGLEHADTLIIINVP